MSLNTKKAVIMTLVSAVIATSFIASAQAKPGKRQANPEAAFNRIDGSGDEVISLDEFTANSDTRTERRFARRDTDEDGFLSLEEATTNRRGNTASDNSEIADDIVACVADLAADDEQIQVPEASRFDSPETRFNAADTSGDGVLSLEEVQANALTKKTAAFESMDSDTSGDVTFDEFSTAAESRQATRRAVRSCIEELTTEEIV